MSKTVKDHLGNTYASVTEMCKHYNIEPYNFKNRIKRGLSVKDALCLPKCSRRRNGKAITDHLGNIFENERYLCEFWGVSVQTYAKRKQRGWSMEERLTRDIKHGRRKHKDERAEMCEALSEKCNIPPDKIMRRLKSGWTVEQATSIPVNKKRPKKTYSAPDGKTYRSIEEMCEAFNVKKITFYKRKVDGQSLENCLRPAGAHLIEQEQTISNKKTERGSETRE